MGEKQPQFVFPIKGKKRELRVGETEPRTKTAEARREKKKLLQNFWQQQKTFFSASNRKKVEKLLTLTAEFEQQLEKRLTWKKRELKLDC